MGVVYKAEDTQLERVVALKFLAINAISEGERQRFLREARAAAQVHHPNICPIHAIGEHHGKLFFAMAFLEGQTVRNLTLRSPLPVTEAVDIAIQVASGLDAAHQHGIVHRDIKSSNIIVDRHGNACILDFGVAIRSGSERITKTGRAVGTPAYMSPEQAQGHAVDQRSDIWSLGVVLFEMLTGQLPFHAEGDLSTMYSIVNDRAPRISELRPQIPAELETVVEKALAKDPAQRWSSAGQLAAALRRIREATPDDATHTIASGRGVSLAGRRIRMRWRQWFSFALLLIAIAAIAVFLAPKLRRTALPEQKEVAVLPLEVIGSDETTRILADGLVETLTSKLSQLEQFQEKVMVVPASEVRSRKITSAEAARRIYGATLVVTGSAQRWGDRIQFTLNLVDARTLRQIAARTRDFDASNPIALRDGAVNDAVRLLDLRLSPAASSAVSSGETSQGSAYAAYLKGRGYLARYDVAGNIDRALSSLQVAVEQDPHYATAYAALGEAYWLKARLSNDKRWADQAIAMASRAIHLDSKLVIGHVKLGEIYAESGRYDDAIREEKIALSIAPGSAEAYAALGQAYEGASRYREAELSYLDAVTRRPTDWYAQLLLGFFYYQRGKYPQAREAYKEALKLTPENEIVNRNLATVDMREGRYADATERLLKTLKYDQSARAYSALGLSFYYQGRFEEAVSAHEAAIDQDSANYIFWGNLGSAYRWVPEGQAKARAALRKAVELGRNVLEITPGEYRVHANLAEYWAKLNDPQKAISEIDQIPLSARQPFMARIALAYELTGNHRQAIETVLLSANNATALNDIKDDPDLKRVWNDPGLQAAISRRSAVPKQ